MSEVTLAEISCRVVEYCSRPPQEYTKDGAVADAGKYLEWRRDDSLETDIKPEWVD